MKRVVIVAADFPPSDRPPALRARFFTRHLPRFGWQPTVLTVSPSTYEWPVDHAFDGLPADLEVVRTGAVPAGLSRRIGIGDVGYRAFPQLLARLWRICREARPNLVFVSVPPYAPMLLGRVIRAGFGIPYVVDYIDPWVSDYYRTLPRDQWPKKRRLADLVSRVLEPRALRRASHVTSVSARLAREIVARYPWFSPANVTEIPYGGEPDDVAWARQQPARNAFFTRTDGCVHVSYVGRGGADMAPAFETLLRGFAGGLASRPEVFRRVRFHCVGTSYDPNGARDFQVRPIAEALGLGAYVDERPLRVPYREALKLLVQSHALVIVGSTTRHYSASKVYTYALTGRPVLALMDSACNGVELLRQLPGCELVEGVGDGAVDAVSDALARIVGGAEMSYSVPAAFEEEFSARAMTARLVQVFDRVTSGSAEA